MPKASDIRLTELRYPLGAGMSHETILFDASWTENGQKRQRGMVVRIKPTRHLVYQDDMFEKQYRLMQLMHDGDYVRVARPLWIERDPALLGAPFFVMEKVAGRVAVSYPPYAQQGWLVEASPADRRLMWEDAVSQLALIQKVSVLDAQFLNLPGDFAANFDQEIDRWRRYLDWVDPNGEQSLLREGFARLLAIQPDNRAEGLVWGDARLGNMMIGDDFSVAAVMDWEQPSLGGALHDLGWWLYSDHVQTEGRGIPTLYGMGSRAETIALWSDVSGKSAADIDWYETFVVFKMECLGLRMQTLRDMPVQDTPGAQVAKYLNR
jgi:aminoglycoside phosphotransferase (APT) family kinase protein